MEIDKQLPIEKLIMIRKTITGNEVIVFIEDVCNTNVISNLFLEQYMKQSTLGKT